MTTIVDQRRRAVTPFRPGDIVEIEEQSPDIVVLKRIKSAPVAKAKLLRRKGRLIFAGEPITTEEVKSLLEDLHGRDAALRRPRTYPVARTAQRAVATIRNWL